MKKFLRVLKVRKEVKAQLKVVEYLKSYNSIVRSADVENSIGAIDYWLNQRVASEVLGSK